MSIEPKKRGRKKKTDPAPIPSTPEFLPDDNIVLVIDENDPEIEVVSTDAESTPEGAKKRGRKPKGGKLILKKTENTDNKHRVTNVILHLKCSTQELNEHNNKLNKIVTNPLLYNPDIPPKIMTYDVNNTCSFSLYDNINSLEKEPEPNSSSVQPKSLAYDELPPKLKNTNPFNDNICSLCNETMQQDDDDDAEVNVKNINMKLKKLKLQLYKNNHMDKKSDCFWCTYDYDNPPCYIPKYELDGNLYGYGSFCRPECAVAFLMKENIDDSVKFERYQLLNQIYNKIYKFKKNIKPAPNPYYTLEKYYGNLSIQEYRRLLKTEHMLLVVDKPMTRILPELHDDNDDFVMNIYGGTSQKNDKTNHNGVYKVKRQSEKQKGPTKSSIMKNTFGV